MGAAAWLEVLDSADRAWPVGRRLPLKDEGLALGLEGQRTLQELPPESGASLLRFLPDGGGWRLEPGRGAWQTMVNGRGAWAGELRHGDVVRFLTFAFRFVVRPWPGPHDAALEAQLAQADEGDARWLVYRDWLLDRGGARGDLQQPPSVDDGARWLWSLAELVQKGHLDAVWCNGLIRGLVLRKLTQRPGPLAWKQAFLGLQHVRQVELVSDAGHAFRMGPLFLELLADLSPVLPLLETVSFGVVDSWEPDDTLAAALEDLRRVAPRLTTTVETLARVARRPGEARLELMWEAPGSGILGMARDKPLVLRAGDSVAFRRGTDGRFVAMHHAALLREDAVRLAHAGSGQGGWHVLAPVHRPGVEVPKLNGRALAGFRLRHEDVVELVPGVVTRFVLD